MKWFSVFSGRDRNPAPNSGTSSVKTLRQGQLVDVDDAFRAWTSRDLSKMLEAASTPTNPVDRHFLLLTIVDETYKQRQEASYRQLCVRYSLQHLEEFPYLAEPLKASSGGILPRVLTFQHYATVLTENGDFEAAIAVCEQAIAYGLRDNTKTGFEGRIDRIRKKAQKFP